MFFTARQIQILSSMSLDKLIKIRVNEVIVVGDFKTDLIAENGSWRLSSIFWDAGMKQIRSIIFHKNISPILIG